MAQEKPVVLAVDMGGSKFIGGLIDEDGVILYHKRGLWASYRKEQILADVCEAIDDALMHYFGPIEAVGITIPGLADPARGLFVKSDVMGISDWPIAQIVSEKYGLPVYVDNDCRACALAEYHFGAGQGCGNFLYLTVSTGVGGALILDGKLYYGAHNNAGELGQCMVENDAAASLCGRAGTLEELANAAGIIQNYLYLGGQKEIWGEAASGKSIDRLARKGDAVAQKAYELEGHYLGKAIAGVYNLLDIEKVIIGGGLSLGFDLFEAPLMASLKAGTYESIHPKLCVLPTPLKYQGALVGAGALALCGSGCIGG